ncbi:MAG: choice-of-anchor L domain-containing protein [candidate division Zixibacteria bacterium]|nr:choice-of-anchor L domain-containing protein [candidate division Zixibacteria bacterium]
MELKISKEEEKMRNIFRAAFVFTISLLILCVGTASAELVIDHNYQLVSSTRVGRTAYNYTYQVSITNNGTDVQNVTAAVSSSSPNTTIIDGSVNFGDVATGSTVAGTDTFTIRQNRSYAFDPNSLTWNIQFELAAQIIPPEGGEIQGEGGIVLIVPASATSDPIPVTITVLQENDLGATPPPNTTFLGGAAIDMGQNELMDNADISMPAPDGVPGGAEVYLAKLVEYAGQTMYQMIDTAIVQNGIIVSQDPAFPGVTTSGNFCFLWAQNVGWIEGRVTNINSGIAVPEAVVTLSGGYWLDIADANGYYSLPAWAGNFIVNAFDEQTGDHGEKQGFMQSGGASILVNVEIGESSGDIHSTLINGNFEDGLTGWVLSGAGDVVDSFGPILPYEGSYMAMISSGNGAVGEASSALEQSFTVPEGANKLTIHYNFISEEYPEFVGSEFNDVMRVTLHTPDGSREIAFEEVNSAIFEPVSGIPCGSGDCTWGQTDWLEASIDVSQWAGTDDTLTLTVHDVGDTIYDSIVLLDDVTIQSSSCEAPNTYNSLYLINSPSCEEKWNMTIFMQEFYSSRLQVAQDILHAKIKQESVDNVTRNAAITVATNLSSLYGLSSTDAKTLMGMGLNKSFEFEGTLFNNDYADIWFSAIGTGVETAVQGGNPAPVMEFAFSSLLSTLNNLWSTIQISALTEQFLEVEVAKAFLYEFYRYGGNYGLLASSYGLPANAKLADTIHAVGNKIGYSDPWWWFEDYETAEVERIVHICVDTVNAKRPAFMN